MVEPYTATLRLTTGAWLALLDELRITELTTELELTGPLEATELGAIELAAIELGATELGAMELAAIELGATELGAMELAAIELGTLELRNELEEAAELEAGTSVSGG